MISFRFHFKYFRHFFFKEVSKIFKEKRIQKKGLDCEVFIGLKALDNIYGDDDGDDDDDDSTQSTVKTR